MTLQTKKLCGLLNDFCKLNTMYFTLRLLQTKYYLLHFERNCFTGVNRLIPQTELLHTSKNEVKVIPSLPAQS